MEMMMGGGGPGRRYDSATGKIELLNLAPGVYQIVAMAQSTPMAGDIDPAAFGARGAPGLSPEGIPVDFGGGTGGFGGGGGFGSARFETAMGTTTVTVGDLDVDDVTITMAPSANISGTLRVEGELPERPRPAAPRGGRVNPANSGLGLAVQLMPAKMDMLSAVYGGGGGRANAAVDGTFRLRANAGEYRVTVSPLPQGAYIKEARMGGVDVLESPLTVPGAEGPLDVVVSMYAGEVSGSIVDARGAPAPGAQAVLIPSRSRQRTDLYKNVNAGQDGRFSIKGVPPGDYKLFAWEYIEPFQWFDPEILESAEDKGIPVRVSASTVANAEVKLIPAGGSK
jgi:hypothetical protein